MKQDAVQLTHFEQAVGRLSGLLLQIWPCLNSQNVREVVTPIVKQVGKEFPDVDMAEVEIFLERLANVLHSDTRH
jgi:hypothetical protein